jgi:hypothetical protein
MKDETKRKSEEKAENKNNWTMDVEEFEKN